MTESNWHQATAPIFCPRCHEMNLEPPAKPMIVREQNGSWSCAACGLSWRQGEMPPKDLR